MQPETEKRQVDFFQSDCHLQATINLLWCHQSETPHGELAQGLEGCLATQPLTTKTVTWYIALQEASSEKKGRGLGDRSRLKYGLGTFNP